MAQLKVISEFKQLIGKTIFAIPTGNAARNSKGRIDEFKVVSCKRKYVELINCYNHSDMYCPETGSTQSNINQGYCGNTGYQFYENIEEIEKSKELAIKIKEIKQVWDGYNTPQLSEEQFEGIYKIMFGETIDNHKLIDNTIPTN